MRTRSQAADGSYASYAELKSMIYAGVGPDDPRVKAALEWIRKHYDVKSNPGMGDAGLYYYYHTLAKALDAAGLDVVEVTGYVLLALAYCRSEAEGEGKRPSP